MSNSEAAAFIVRLYGEYRRQGNLANDEYEHAIAMACAALQVSKAEAIILQGGDPNANANGSSRS